MANSKHNKNTMTSDKQVTIIKTKSQVLFKTKKTLNFSKTTPTNYNIYRLLIGNGFWPKSYAQLTIDDKIIGDITKDQYINTKNDVVELIYNEYLKLISSKKPVIISNGNVDILSLVYTQCKLWSYDNIATIRENESDKIKRFISSKIRRRYFLYHSNKILSFTSVKNMLLFVNGV